MIAGKTETPLLIINGSARSDGDTGSAIRSLLERLPLPTTHVDLCEKRIQRFDYAEPAREDDFGDLVELMLGHPSILFATPVHWYAMSGLMKTFFDRLTDLLSKRDPPRRGRRLAGREIWLLAVGSDPDLPPGFEQPFAMTAGCFAMVWRGSFYVRSGRSRSGSQIGALADALAAGPRPHI